MRLVIFLSILFSGCVPISKSITYADESAMHRIRRIVVLPFRHSRGPYFGEVCRQNFYAEFKKNAPRQVEIVSEKNIREALTAQFGNKDIELTHEQGLKIARELGADTAIFGVCAPPEMNVYFMDTVTGHIICDAGLPATFRRGAATDYTYRSARVLVERLVREIPCLNCSDTPATGTIGYAIPRSAAVMPVAGEAGREGAIFRSKVHSYLQAHGIDSVDPAEIDTALATAFSSSDVVHLQEIKISSIAAALGVDAVVAIQISSVKESKWAMGAIYSLSPIGIIPFPIHSSSQSYINISLYTKSGTLVFQAHAPYSCTGMGCSNFSGPGSFKDIWKQFPTWLR